MKWFAVLLFLLLFSLSVFSQQPYILTEINATNINVGEKPIVTVKCHNSNGAELGGERVNLAFYSQSGILIDDTKQTLCGTTTVGTPSFNSPGLYYVVGEFDCAPNCCTSSCSNRDWFSVSRPFSGINIDESNAFIALLVCLLVLVIIRKKEG